MTMLYILLALLTYTATSNPDPNNWVGAGMALLTLALLGLEVIVVMVEVLLTILDNLRCTNNEKKAEEQAKSRVDTRQIMTGLTTEAN